MVYIADSDVEVANSIQFLIKTEQIESRVFANGHELLDETAVLTPGCVVTEAELPDISGVELLKRLLKAGFSMPVIVLSSHSAVDQAVEAVKSGAWDYFEKPFVQRVLLDSVKRALESQNR